MTSHARFDRLENAHHLSFVSLLLLKGYEHWMELKCQDPVLTVVGSVEICLEQLYHARIRSGMEEVMFYLCFDLPEQLFARGLMEVTYHSAQGFQICCLQLFDNEYSVPITISLSSNKSLPSYRHLDCYQKPAGNWIKRMVDWIKFSFTN